MFSKLAFNNVRKSLKDYTIYFLTLTFAVCMFYVFNSIESQKSMMELSKSQFEIMGVLTKVINGVSVFVAIVFSFLIIYANNFLIKRRKKEFGIYMVLGMEKGKISKILVIETLIISFFSLGIGLIIGIFASQGLSVVTAKLFEVDLTNFHFTFSKSALVKSIICFGIIFVIVIIFNVIIISKHKLISLLNAHKQNQKMKLKNQYFSTILFIFSLACLYCAYRCILHNKLSALNLEFKFSIAFGIIGTVLFFMSLSGFLLKVIQGNKRFYFKGLNMFILRQINSKINTTFVSMSLICLMLFITIGTLSTGVGVANSMKKILDKSTPFDASFYLETRYDNNENANGLEINIAQIMGESLGEIADNYVEVNKYILPITNSKILSDSYYENMGYIDMKLLRESKAIAIKLSDYNKILQMQGLEPISLEENEYVLNCSYSTIKEYYKPTDIHTLEIDGENYKLYKNAIQETQLQTLDSQNDFGTLVFPDFELKNRSVIGKILNLNYPEVNEIYENKFEKEINNCTSEINSNHLISGGYMTGYATKMIVYQKATGVKVIASFLAVYIGLVFLIACVAILALQQLSESSDNIERYKLLRELGTNEKMIKKSLFWQIFIYFMMPLGLAITHSIVGIYVANNIVKTIGELDILANTIFTAVIFLIIYGGYFIATYLSCKSMIRAKK